MGTKIGVAGHLDVIRTAVLALVETTVEASAAAGLDAVRARAMAIEATASTLVFLADELCDNDGVLPPTVEHGDELRSFGNDVEELRTMAGAY